MHTHESYSIFNASRVLDLKVSLVVVFVLGLRIRDSSHRQPLHRRTAVTQIASSLVNSPYLGLGLGLGLGLRLGLVSVRVRVRVSVRVRVKVRVRVRVRARVRVGVRCQVTNVYTCTPCYLHKF